MQGQSASARMVMEVAEGKENPFHTLEALGEHIEECWRHLAEAGEEVWDKSGSTVQRPRGKPDTMMYNIHAIDEYQKKIFQYFAVLEHDVYLASDGDKEAFKRMQQRLQIIAVKHQKEWDEIR